ncbi:MAG TPA: DUF6766 family protein [Thermoanaerobaculia bacterium]|nr:DUF6766 family protein [Thermoanaerobaculia bacterium]
MSKVWRENGLSLVLLALFVLSFAGQIGAGQRAHNEEQRQHGDPAVGVGEYLRSGHFLEATAENWESEFLQMFAYVLLTAWLYQKGSSESRKLDAENKQDRDPREHRRRPRAPWPVRKGGEVVLWLYEHSLALAFLLLFLFSMAWHARGGLIHHNEEQLAHGQPPIELADYVGGAQFWFESFQNWQSEFLSLVTMVVLSIWLRQRYSPESKPVDAPHDETGAG